MAMWGGSQKADGVLEATKEIGGNVKEVARLPTGAIGRQARLATRRFIPSRK
jgi:hypothetical protein